MAHCPHRGAPPCPYNNGTQDKRPMLNINDRFNSFASDLADWEMCEAYNEFIYAIFMGISDDEVMEIVEHAVAMAA